MAIDLPPIPKLWTPQKPAIIRALSLDDAKLAMPLWGTFGAASARALRSNGVAATVQNYGTMSQSSAGLNTGNSLGRVGLKFTPIFSGTVTSAQMGKFLASNQQWTAQLYTDNSGSPGSTIGSATGGVLESTTLDITLTFGSPPSVTAGTTYWVVFARSVSTEVMDTCAEVVGIVTGGHGSSATSITDGLNVIAGRDLRLGATVTP